RSRGSGRMGAARHRSSRRPRHRRATSGIGRATALACSRAGVSVVLVARREAPLTEAAAECDRLAGRAVAVPADVRDPDALTAVADAAEARFGGIDVWVNNAGVTLMGRF